MVTFYSPFNCIAENTQFLLKTKSVQPALDFIKTVPSVWDETFVLPQSKIGELAAIARRNGKDWYLGVLRSGATQEMIIDCSFLGDGEYTAEIFTDDIEAERIDLKGLNKEADLRQWDTAVPFKKSTETVSKEKTLTVYLAEHGGAVIKFIKK